MKSNLLAYAVDFVSFLLQKCKHMGEVKNIILFGSVARDETTKISDIDLFIDVIKQDNKFENELVQTYQQFLLSTKYKSYWKLFGLTNEIKLTVGVLDEWKELKPSIMSNGIVLYGKYKGEIKNGKHLTFFIWENVSPNSKRVLFNKQLFGYNQNEKFYSGLLQKYHGEKLGKGCIVVPLEHALVVHQLFKRYKITVKIRKVAEY